jgi:uncharacterized protein YjbI with pentapeptide repeats
VPVAVPQFALVRPRVTRHGVRDPLPIDDIVADLVDQLEDHPHGWVIEISGLRGSGKSTAVAHVAAALGNNPRLTFRDQPTPVEMNVVAAGQILIAADIPPAFGRVGIEIKLAPWGRDDLLEYLLATHPDACGAVLARLGSAAAGPWTPRIAVVALEQLATNEQVYDAPAALASYVRERVPDDAQWTAACRYCLAALTSKGEELYAAVMQQAKAGCPGQVRMLLGHDEVRQPLAVEWLFSQLRAGSTVELEHLLPAELVAQVGERCRTDASARAALNRSLSTAALGGQHAMAASIAFAADATWRPTTWRGEPWKLSGGHFPGAAWNDLDLTRGELAKADLGQAQLERAWLVEASLHRANLDGANLKDANLIHATIEAASLRDAVLVRAKLSVVRARMTIFSGADLTDASLMDADLSGADFSGACLRQADLTRASLHQVKFEETDLRGAMLRGAHLAQVDLRTAQLEGACLDESSLVHAQMEDIRWPDARLQSANLSHAHLTGSVMPRADLRGAILKGAGLADIQWEDADLRRADLRQATFHMGSSRSGLVGSPIACEGSKTGFYTDDYEDKHFKRPEEIRKANLCGADLRGARIDGLDFYLVDLRGAKLEAEQFAHVRRCGAILGHVPA